MRPTERRHAGTTNLDRLDTAGVVRAIHDEDAAVPAAVARALPALEKAVEMGVLALRSGGRIHYFGAGSSGRYGALDAAEIPPTYGVPPDRFVAHLAGGDRALTRSLEGVEDDDVAGATEAAAVTGHDLVVGVTASGRTPYVGGALRAARGAGAGTVLISSDPEAELAPLADVHVVLDTGPEVVMGSTRMKAGTAAKVALHTFSTAVMVRVGRTYSNLMVEVAGSNDKLRSRRVRILVEATGADHTRCVDALRAAGDDLKTAIVTILAGCAPDRARTALRGADGVVTVAVATLAGGV